MDTPSIDFSFFQDLTQEEKDNDLIGFAAQTVNLEAINICIMVTYRCLQTGERIDKAINKHAWEAVMMASGEDFTNHIHLLIEAGANVNATGPGGLTALMCAAFLGKKETVNLLLENGANVQAAHDNGATALFCSTFYNNTPITYRLLTELSAEEHQKFLAIHQKHNILLNDFKKLQDNNELKELRVKAPFLLNVHPNNIFNILPLDLIRLISSFELQLQKISTWRLDHIKCFLPLRGVAAFRALSIEDEADNQKSPCDIVATRPSINK